MLITVSSPKKGLGQTVTAINIAARLTNYTKGKILLIDINKYSKDVGNYLSSTLANKGLDSIISLADNGLLNKDNFVGCVKEITPQIDVLISNECFELSEKTIEKIMDLSGKIYDAVVVDTIAGNSTITKKFIECSEVLVLVLSQQVNVVNMASDNKFYQDYRDKVIAVVNMYRDKVRFGMHEIKNNLKIGIVSKDIFQINYDEALINECNDRSILNYTLNDKKEQMLTIRQIENIIDCAIDKTDANNLKRSSEKKQSIFKKFLSKG